MVTNSVPVLNHNILHSSLMTLSHRLFSTASSFLSSFTVNHSLGQCCDVGVVPWSDIHCVLMTFERLADVIKLSPSARHWQWNSGTFRGCVSNCHCAVKACTVELLSPHAWWRWRCCLNSTFHNRSMLKKLWSHHQQLALRPPLNTLPFSTSSSASPSPLFILTSSSILHFSLLCVKMLIYYEWLLCQWLFIKSDSVYNNY